VNIHRSRTVKNDQGEDVTVQSGPVHRFHPLVEEDCAICKHRHERYEKGTGIFVFRHVMYCAVLHRPRLVLESGSWHDFGGAIRVS